MLLGAAHGKVTIDSSGVTRGVKTAKTSMLQLADAGVKLGDGMKKAGTALSLGLTLPIVAFGVASVKSAMESESALANLRATLKSTGEVAGVTFEELTANAAALQKVTKFSDETIVTGQAMLLTFTKIGKEVFPEATETMLNMAEKFGSVEEASIQLGKALNDPVAGVGALRRVGVQLSDQQEQQVKDFMAVNDIAGAQRVILKELQVEFGGLAKAAGQTPEGQWIIFLNTLDELKETVGKVILPILIDFAKNMTILIDKFNNLPPFVQKGIIIFFGLLAVLGPVLVILGSLISTVSTVVGVFSGLGVTLPVIASGIGTVGAVITGTLLPALAAVAVAALPILAVLAAVVVTLLFWAVIWKTNLFGIRDNMTMVVSVIKSLWKALMAFLKGDTEAGLAFLTEAFETFRARVDEIFMKLFGIKDAFGKFMEFLRTSLTRVREYIVHAFSNVDWSQIGKYILFGIANGMLFGIPALIVAATKAVKAVLDTFDKGLEAKSPSRKMMQRGKWSAQGYMMGWDQTMSPDAISRAMVRPITNTSSSQQNININIPPGLSIQQVRGLIAENNEQLMGSIIGALGGA